MKKIINKLNNKEILVLSILTGWVSLNLILLFIGSTQNNYLWGPSNTPYFWPFDEPNIGNSYDFTEFIAYAMVPCIIFLIYISITNEMPEKEETDLKIKYFNLKQYIVLNKQFFTPYFIWAGLQVIFLLSSNCTWEKGMYYPQLFFPFSGYPRYFYAQEKNIWTLLVYTYSYSEFFVYSLLPLVIRYFFLAIRGQPKNKIEKHRTWDFIYKQISIINKFKNKNAKNAILWNKLGENLIFVFLSVPLLSIWAFVPLSLAHGIIAAIINRGFKDIDRMPYFSHSIIAFVFIPTGLICLNMVIMKFREKELYEILINSDSNEIKFIYIKGYNLKFTSKIFSIDNLKIVAKKEEDGNKEKIKSIIFYRQNYKLPLFEITNYKYDNSFDLLFEKISNIKEIVS